MTCLKYSSEIDAYTEVCEKTFNLCTGCHSVILNAVKGLTRKMFHFTQRNAHTINITQRYSPECRPHSIHKSILNFLHSY